MKLIPSKSRQPLTIEFTPEECDVLAIICAKVGGSVKNSPRGVTEKLGDILWEQGYEWSNGPFAKDGLVDKSKIEGSLYFKGEE